MGSAWLQRLFAPALILLMIGVLVLRDGDPGVHKRQIYVLGTQFQVTVPADQLSEPQFSAAMGQVNTRLHAFQHLWQPQGEGALGQLNRALASSASTDVPEPLQALLGQAQQLARRSQGTFDPGIEALVRLWGFDDPEHFRSEPPAAAAIEQALQQPHRLAEATIEDGQLIAAAPGLSLDMGGIAKGTATELALAELREAGATAALVNAGGDIQALGTRGQRPWHVAIRHPRPTPERRLLAAIDLHDGEAIFTSGDYERSFDHDGQRYHHLLDPRTGRPARGAQSATVLHRDAAVADAAATAVFVAGPSGFKALVRALDLEHAMLIDNTGRALVTPALASRLEWLSDTDVQVLDAP